jgi:hypothetical protein
MLPPNLTSPPEPTPLMAAAPTLSPPVPVVSAPPGALALGKLPIGQPHDRAVALTNTGQASATVTLGASGPGFAVQPSTLTLGPGASASFVVRYTPPSAGPHTGVLQLTGQNFDFSHTVSLSGEGIEITQEHVGGSHLLFKLPDYGESTFERRQGTPDEQVTMTSYLRLGRFSWEDEPPRAKELLRLIPQAGPPGDPARGDLVHYPDLDADGVSFDGLAAVKAVGPGATNAAGAPIDLGKTGNREAFFIDDVRKRAGDAVGSSVADDPGHGLTQAQRQRESAKLYARGGWRDHSDGNRLTTTYGDKVEVVRGNYKMIVMGRQDDPGEAMGWEASGSHVADYAPGTMPGASYWHEWIDDYRHGSGEGARKGVWLLVNTTENVYEYARKSGNFRDEIWGDVIEEYIGGENPPEGASAGDDAQQGQRGHEPPVKLEGINYNRPQPSDADISRRLTPPADNAGNVRRNPHVISKTWAERVDTHVGSPSTKVPVVSDKTWAGSIEAYARADGRLLEVFTGKHITEYRGMDPDDYGAGGEYDPSNWSDRVSTVACAKVFDEEIHAHALTLTKWGTAWEMWMGAFGELFVGPRFSMTATTSAELTLGASVEAFAGIAAEIFMGLHLGVELGKSVSLRVGPSTEFYTSPSQAFHLVRQVVSISDNGLGLVHSRQGLVIKQG